MEEPTPTIMAQALDLHTPALDLHRTTLLKPLYTYTHLKYSFAHILPRRNVDGHLVFFNKAKVRCTSVHTLHNKNIFTKFLVCGVNFDLGPNVFSEICDVGPYYVVLRAQCLLYTQSLFYVLKDKLLDSALQIDSTMQHTIELHNFSNKSMYCVYV